MIILVLTLSVLIANIPSVNFASNASTMMVDIRVNDIRLSFDSDPYITEGRTIIPVRAIVEVLGAQDVVWNQELKEVTIMLDDKILKMIIGQKEYNLDGEIYSMDVAASIVNNRTMVPLRVVAESFDCDVKWNNDFRTIEITKELAVIDDCYINERQYAYEDVLWLARIVNVEALDINYDAKLAVANVVLNRMNDPRFPNTVYDVIYDTTYTTQFPPAHKGGFSERVPDDQSYIAAKNALDGSNNIDVCLYFNNVSFKWKANDFYKVIDGEYFYY